MQLRRQHADTHRFAPDLTRRLLPSLGEATADRWAGRLRMLRATLLATWGGYLLLPPARSRASSVCYAVGAFAYNVCARRRTRHRGTAALPHYSHARCAGAYHAFITLG